MHTVVEVGAQSRHSIRTGTSVLPGVLLLAADAGVAASCAAAVVATSANAADASVAASGVAAGGAAEVSIWSTVAAGEAAEGCSCSVSEFDSDVLLRGTLILGPAAGMMSVAGTSVLLLAVLLLAAADMNDAR